MPRKNYVTDIQRLGDALASFEAEHGPLPGIVGHSEREVLIDQIVDSEARVRYTNHLLTRSLDSKSGDPRDPGFHPLKAAILHAKADEFDEACWLVYLYVHFGMHKKAGWWYLRQMYGACGSTPTHWWTWHATANDPTSFRFWLDDHQDDFHAIEGPHGFGNHRKYVSLNAWTEQGTGACVESYIDWVVAGGGNHAVRYETLTSQSPAETFDVAYRSLGDVRQFGRTARFDYLTMLSRLDLLDATAPHAYMTGASGPLKGAKLLMHGDKKADVRTNDVQSQLTELCHAIGVAPDVLEDAICNWQKGPDKYVRFSA